MTVWQAKPLRWFLILVSIFSAVCYVFMFWAGKEWFMPTAGLLMWMPALAAMAVKACFFKGRKALGVQKCGFSFVALAALLPLLYFGLSYGIYYLAVPGGFSGGLVAGLGGDAASFLINMLIYIIAMLVTAMGEELGWRGFLLPQMLEIWSLKKAILINGLIWVVWHFPMLIAGYYMPGTPWWYQLLMFTLNLLCVSAIASMLTVRSKSVWPAVVLHASHNFFDQIVFANISGGDLRFWLAGETGILTLGVLLAILFVAYRVYAGSGKALSPK